jgi:pre-mRNA-splicing factor ISY1
MNGTNYLTGGGTINKYIESNSIKIKGYRYFGRARELSDVQELIERQNEIRALNSKNASDQVNLLKKVKELEERVDVHYFGYLEDIGSYESHQSDVRREARNILGDLLSDSSDDEARDEKSTLSKAERKATKQRTKVLKNVETTGPVTLIESSIPVSLDQVQGFLVEKRRKELESKYNI